MGTHRQAVRFQPQDEQVQQGYFPDAVHHSAAEAESDLDQQEGLNAQRNRLLNNKQGGRSSLIVSNETLYLSGKKTTYIDRSDTRRWFMC